MQHAPEEGRRIYKPKVGDKSGQVKALILKYIRRIENVCFSVSINGIITASWIFMRKSNGFNDCMNVGYIL